MQKVDDNTLWAFVSGDLEDERSEELNDLLAKDKELLDRYNEMASLLRGVEHWSRGQSIQMVLGIIREEKERNKRRLWLYAGIVTIMVILVFLLISSIRSDHDPEPMQLYASHFSPMTLPGLTRSTELADLEDTSRMYYALKKFDKVAALDQEGLEADVPGDLMLAMGISLMDDAKFERAEVYLSQVFSSGSALLSDHAEWYLILLKMAKGEGIDEETLVKMSNSPGHDRQTDAQRLLDALN
jgi:hypothetical protein